MNPPSASVASGKILVIDDNPIIQRTMYFALRDKGYTVLMCGDITEALKIVRQERIIAILLDINFPPDLSIFAGDATRDGFWALEWLHRLEEAKDTPILVISSDPPEKSKAHALAAGAAGYFHKPVDKHELAATLASLLAHKAAPSPA
jgi:CheY-like chemotaxis protein